MIGRFQGCALAQVEWTVECDRIRTEMLPYEKAVAGRAKLKRLKH